MAAYDCILVNPRSLYYSPNQKTSPYLPAGLLSIAGVLEKKGLRTFVLDMVVEDDPEAALDRYLGEGGVPLVGFTVMTAQLRHAAEMTRYVRRRSPGTKVIWGGVHAALFPEEVLRGGFADFVCSGEGEYTAQELTEALKAGGDPAGVKNLYFLRGGELVFTGRRAPNDLDALPFLNLDLIDYARYKKRIVFRGSETMAVNSGVLVSSVGCPYRCTFCVNINRRLAFGGYRAKSAARLADELEFLINRYGITYFDFLDENFFVKRSHPEEFIKEVRRRGLKFSWYTNMRADAFDRGIVDEAMIRELKDIGLYYVSMGAESGSQRILDKLKKDITVEQIVRSGEIVVRNGLGVVYSFMMGMPGETQADVEATLHLIQRLRAMSPRISIVGPQIFRPYPGGDLYEECVKDYGYAPPADMEEWSGSVDQLTGFESIDKLTWIKDKDFIRKVSFYIEFANLNLGALHLGPLKRLVFRAVRWLADFRIRHRLWAFNPEMRLIMAYKARRAAANAGRAA